jgi:hypothetical protein
MLSVMLGRIPYLMRRGTREMILIAKREKEIISVASAARSVSLPRER